MCCLLSESEHCKAAASTNEGACVRYLSIRIFYMSAYTAYYCRQSVLCICRDLATCTPSLANLVSQMLNRNLRQEGAPHDCEQDAAAAMQLVNHAVQHGLPPPMEAPEIKASVPCR